MGKYRICPTFTFPNNAENKEVLEQIGFSSQSIKNGQLSCKEAEKDGVNFDLLLNLTTASHFERGETLKFPIDRLKKLLKGKKEIASTLFRANECPSIANTANTIIEQMSGAHKSELTVNIDKEFEQICSFDQLRQRGILRYFQGYFSSKIVPKEIAEAGRGVIRIDLQTDADGEEHWGSGIILSKDGEVETSYHVLYDEKGNFKRGYKDQGDGIEIAYPSITIRGKTYLIEEAFVEDYARKQCMSPSGDRVKFRIPALAQISDLSPIKVANKPPLRGARLWHVGFPDMVSDTEVKPESKLTFVTGTVISFSQERMEIKSTAITIPGMSGGPVFNDHGELVGLNFGVAKNKETQIAKYSISVFP